MMSKHNSPAALSLSRSIFIVVVIRARNLFGCVVFMHNGRDEPCRPERLLALAHFFSFRSCEKTSGSKKKKCLQCHHTEKTFGTLNFQIASTKPRASRAHLLYGNHGAYRNFDHVRFHITFFLHSVVLRNER